MTVMAEFSVVPMGQGVSISPVVAKIMKLVDESGVSYRANPMGTVLEGDWDTVMAVVKKCHEAALQDAARVLTSIKIDDRKDGEARMDVKLESVERKLGKKLKTGGRAG